MGLHLSLETADLCIDCCRLHDAGLLSNCLTCLIVDMVSCGIVCMTVMRSHEGLGDSSLQNATLW